MIYIDSADRDATARLLKTNLFAGVTTNPTILQRSGLSAADLPDLYNWVSEHGSKKFFAQATGLEVSALRDSAHAVLDLGENVVVKLVATAEGLTVARELTSAGHEVLVTAVYHPTQMLLAAAAGAGYIAPYVGRATAAGRDGIELVHELAIAGADLDTRIVAASLRTADQVTQVTSAGAHDVTISVAVADALLSDELTLAATQEFEDIIAGRLAA